MKGQVSRVAFLVRAPGVLDTPPAARLSPPGGADDPTSAETEGGGRPGPPGEPSSGAGPSRRAPTPTEELVEVVAEAFLYLASSLAITVGLATLTAAALATGGAPLTASSECGAAAGRELALTILECSVDVLPLTIVVRTMWRRLRGQKTPA